MLQENVSLIPDRAEIQRDLEYMTARWGELGQKAKFEVRAFKEHASPQIGKFNHDWIGDAVDWIDSLNRRGYNIYVVRNPIRYETAGSATDDDIIASFFLWADCDDPAAAGNVHRFDGPKWAAAVVTGTVPSVRVHTYWALDEPVTDMAQWRQMQISIARHFASDGSVINPSRIMRVGGTISYPDERKRKRGYINELTTIRTEYPEGREPVSMDQMQRVFAAAQPAQPRLSEMATPAPRQGGLQIDTGEHHKKPVDHYADILRRARTDGQKHTGVRDLTASLAGAGVPRNMAEAIVRDACPVWDANVENLIESAYREFYRKPDDHQFREMSETEKASVEALPFKPWGARNLAAIPHPEFVYSDFYARGYTSVTVAPPKAGKSMLGIAEAVDMATGRGILTGSEQPKKRVLYYNAEDDLSVIESRVAAILTHYKIDQVEIAETLFPVSGVDVDGFYMVTGQEGVINEALFVSLEKFIAQNSIDVLFFDPLQDLSRSPETNEVFRVLGQRLRKMATTHRVAIGLIHHTRKMAPGTTATIDDARGGSALRGTARFNRLLLPMSEDEGVKSGVDNHRHFMRIADMESNLAPPSADVNRWFQKISVNTPNGHSVGAVEPWQWPDAFDGVTREDACRVQAALRSIDDDPPRLNTQSAGWVGNVVARVLNVDADDKAVRNSISAMIKTWTKTGVLEVVEVHDARAGRMVKAVVAGKNNPMTEVNT